MKIVEKTSGRASGWVSHLAATPRGLPDRGYVWVAFVPTGKCLSGASPDPQIAEAFLDEALVELNANPYKRRHLTTSHQE